MSARVKRARSARDPGSGLTERQAQYVRAIWMYLSRHGRPMALADLCEAMGTNNRWGMLDSCVRPLRLKGWLLPAEPGGQARARSQLRLVGVAMSQPTGTGRHLPAIETTPEGIRLYLMLRSPLGRGKAAQP